MFPLFTLTLTPLVRLDVCAGDGDSDRGSRCGNISSFDAMLVAALLSLSTKDPAMGQFFWPMEDTTTADASPSSSLRLFFLCREEQRRSPRKIKGGGGGGAASPYDLLHDPTSVSGSLHLWQTLEVFHSSTRVKFSGPTFSRNSLRRVELGLEKCSPLPVAANLALPNAT